MDPCRGLTTGAAVTVRTKDNALVKLSKSSPLFKLRMTQKHVKPKIIWSLALIVFSSRAWWRMGTDRKSLTSLDTEDSTVLWKIAQSDPKRLAWPSISPASVMDSGSGTFVFVTWQCWDHFWPRCSFKHAIVLKLNRRLQNTQYAKRCSSISANPQTSAHWAIVQSGGGRQ